MKIRNLHPLWKLLLFAFGVYLISIGLFFQFTVETITKILTVSGFPGWMFLYASQFAFMTLLILGIIGGIFIFHFSIKVRFQVYLIWWNWIYWKNSDYVEEKTLIRLKKLIYQRKNFFRSPVFECFRFYFQRIFFLLSNANDESTIFLETCIEDYNSLASELLDVQEKIQALFQLNLEKEQFSELKKDREEIKSSFLHLIEKIMKFFEKDFSYGEINFVESNAKILKEGLSSLFQKIKSCMETYEEIRKL